MTVTDVTDVTPPDVRSNAMISEAVDDKVAGVLTNMFTGFEVAPPKKMDNS
jgi:hypothetical protein